MQEPGPLRNLRESFLGRSFIAPAFFFVGPSSIDKRRAAGAGHRQHVVPSLAFGTTETLLV